MRPLSELGKLYITSCAFAFVAFLCTKSELPKYLLKRMEASPYQNQVQASLIKIPKISSKKEQLETTVLTNSINTVSLNKKI